MFSILRRYSLVICLLLALLPALLLPGFSAEQNNTVTHQLYINGKSDGTFRPREELSRAELAQMVFSLGNYPQAEGSFSDVPASAWYARAVNSLAAKGILTGFSDGTFRPKQSVTRAQLVTVLQRLSGKTSSGNPHFTDVPSYFWARKAIALAQEMGWVVGYNDGSFRPEKAVTRAEVVTVLNRYLGRSPDRASIDACQTLRFFPDVQPGSWYYYDVMEAAVTHTVRTDQTGAHWISTEPVAGNLADDFYLINGKLYAARQGSFLHAEMSGTLHGVPFTCTGPSGVCLVDTEVLRLHGGELLFIRNGEPEYLPGNYPDGFYIRSHHLFAAREGTLLQEKTSGTLGGVSFTCIGASGFCTADTEVLTLADGELAFLKNGLVELTPGSFENGFYLRGGNLYAGYHGNLIHTKKTAKLYGISFSCAGASGICRVDAEVLRLADGQLMFLKEGTPEILPGQYENGFYLRGGNLYAAYQGFLIHTEKTATLFGISFTCSGADGVCTVRADVLKLAEGELIFLKDGRPELLPGAYARGFYVRGGNLYASRSGSLEVSPVTDVIHGITFHCAGANGHCTAEAEVLTLADGELVFLRNGTPEANPGAFPDGFYVRKQHLFAVRDRHILRQKLSGVLQGTEFSCIGSSGFCTARTQILRLADGDYALLRGQKLDGLPGSYPDGFTVRNGLLYAVLDGSVLHENVIGEIDGCSFSCSGESGVCDADWAELPLDGIDLGLFAERAKHVPACGFSDVPADNPARKAIALQCSLGTMAGDAEGLFRPDTKLTYREAIHGIVTVYETYFLTESLSDDADPEEEIHRAKTYGILAKDYPNYDAAIPRRELAILLCGAMHGRELEAINEIARIPGLSESHPAYDSFMTLYRAGVMRGVNERDEAIPSKGITRADFALTLNRLVLPTQRFSFTIPDKVIESFQYGVSGSGKYPLAGYRIGSGPNVLVLTYAVHGWEDVWLQDGKALVYLADQVKAYLEANYDLVRDGGWTVYILRCVNPDGLYDGVTCNGPGRCTTTYFDSTGQLVSGDGRGIDINRCFPYNYVSRTDARNYNGTAPLQCVEARALASFVQSVKGSGKNLCIDTHGWLSQIIPSSGKGTIYQAFLRQFPNSSYADLRGSSGYFSSWAYSIGYDACLFELPWGITSFDAFVTGDCVWKYEAVLADLLANYSDSGAIRGPFPPDECVLDGN